MANTSIFAAFERMWQHVVALIGNKADITDINNAIEEVKESGELTEQVIATMPKETWTFTLEDGSTVTKVVPLI